MQKKNILRLSFLVIALAGAFVAIRSTGKTEEPSTCKASMDRCPRKENKKAAPGMIWENFSRQFISTTSFN